MCRQSLALELFGYADQLVDLMAKFNPSRSPSDDKVMIANDERKSTSALGLKGRDWLKLVSIDLTEAIEDVLYRPCWFNLLNTHKWHNSGHLPANAMNHIHKL
jgi:hypothetical protein